MGQETMTLNAGCCPWCSAVKTIQKTIQGVTVTMTHPPEACCLPRAVWNLSWLVEHAHDPDYAEDIRRIKERARALLAGEPDPVRALESARKLASARRGHGNVYAVVQALVRIVMEGRQ